MTTEHDARTAVQTTAVKPIGLSIDGRSARDPQQAGRGVYLARRTRPTFGFRLPVGPHRAYDITLRTATGELLWSSGVVESARTTVPSGIDLAARSAFEWDVRLLLADGTWSALATAGFETGGRSLADWSASWVDVPARSRLRRTFDAPQPVHRARLHLTGQGLVRAELNGVAVNADHLDPTRTDATRALYRSYDVTDLVRATDNVLDFVVAVGEWIRTERDPRLLAELVIDHPDGSQTVIHPDRHSTIATSRIDVDEPFYLERHDVTLEGLRLAPVPLERFVQPRDTNTATSGDDDAAAAPPFDVTPDGTPPARVVERVALTELRRSGGVRLFDVGTNIAGRSRLVIEQPVPSGSVIRLVHGEHVGDDGRIDTTNLTMPFDNGRIRQVVEWVATGSADDVIEPWFAYHGFRYVEVSGLPDDAEVIATVGVLHTDLQPIGEVTTDNSIIGEVLSRGERTLLNNLHGVPEDCPTREQSAWTGDAASVAEFTLSAFDGEAFFAKWIGDLITSQAADGSLPAIAPDVRTPRLPADPVWGSALHRLLLGHWLHYGDADLVRASLPALRAWARFQLSCVDASGIVAGSPISYGHDWLALEQTPPEVHHTAATIDCLLSLARLEDDLDERTPGDPWRGAVADLRRSARAHFFDDDRGAFANGSQGAYAAAIDAGILTGADADDAAARIEADIRRRGNRVSGGFATTRTIVRALAATGRSQAVMDTLSQPAEPGVGAMLATGPGTFWECWWIDPTNTGTGSLDHVGLGGVFAGWVWTTLAGLTPTSRGYRTFDVAPQFVTGVDTLSLSTATPWGTVAVSYRVAGAAAALRVEVPDGSTARVLTAAGVVTLTGGSHELDVPAPRAAATRPAPEAPWTAPPIAPAAADVVGPRALLGDAVSGGTLIAGADSAVAVVPGLTCMPIPHAQPGGDVVEVTAASPGSTPAAVLTFPAPLDASDATFLYAHIDLCDERWDRSFVPTLIARSSDGTERHSRVPGWPAGWNRVALDVTAWPGRSAITSITLSVSAPEAAAEDLLMPQSGEPATGGFHLGEVGFSTARRTW